MPARKRVTPIPDDTAPTPKAKTVKPHFQVRQAFPVLCTDGTVRHITPRLNDQLTTLLSADQLAEFTAAGLLTE